MPTPITKGSTAPAPPQHGTAGAPPGRLVVLLAASCGLTVANLYYAQPLLDVLRLTFRLDEGTVGTLVTVTQIGYALGMLLLVPLGDRLENRRLISVLLAVVTAAMAVAGLAPDFAVLLGAALIAGAASVVAQILVPFAADLAPDHTRGQVVGRVMSGLLAGILLSRTLGSLLAEAAGWRAVYLVSAALMGVLAVTLRIALPRRTPTAQGGYAALLRSTLRLVRTQPVLRRRAVYQAAMFGAFSAFWTTISYVLTDAPFHYSQIGIGLFALVGAAGALVAPLAGRWADRGRGRPMTAAGFVLCIGALGLAMLGQHHIVLLVAAAVLLDLAVQSTLIVGQHAIYQLDGSARARLNSIYIATFFFGGALGSQIGSFAFRWGGWTAVTGCAAVLPALALLLWLTDRSGGSGRAARRPSGTLPAGLTGSQG
ncbi:MFS transporter [Streptomyces bambusae]|uniref:MFS transporter n=1 Tax=Streptomyces bambusae TaxID=1550616 RepID=UPI001CFEB5F1|nr:MFS transporter [Streptomyces bambusae]MCB5164694.1 MFS transporter [Streptomyces bambusae]